MKARENFEWPPLFVCVVSYASPLVIGVRRGEVVSWSGSLRTVEPSGVRKEAKDVDKCVPLAQGSLLMYSSPIYEIEVNSGSLRKHEAGGLRMNRRVASCGWLTKRKSTLLGCPCGGVGDSYAQSEPKRSRSQTR